MTPNKGSGFRRTLPLPRRATAPGLARTWVRERLAEWNLPLMEQDCLLVTSELVTNAVRYGSTPIRISVCLADDALTVEVADARPAVAPGGELDELAETGRGLDIVRACSDTFAFQRHTGDGKSAVATWARAPFPA